MGSELDRDRYSCEIGRQAATFVRVPFDSFPQYTQIGLGHLCNLWMNGSMLVRCPGFL